MSTTTVFNLIILFPILGVVALLLIVYLVARRIREKKKESFEKRDN